VRPDWYFVFSLAKELGMTVKQLTGNLSLEELIGWSAFFELKNEREEKEKERVQRSKGVRTR
tara:strand:+ start:156 stop:341 length:186 start_codon:yes stop_codon:yes gene_type:complete